MISPREYAELTGIGYSTVIARLQAGAIAGAVQIQFGKATLWQIPEIAVRHIVTPKLGRRPRKEGTEKK